MSSIPHENEIVGELVALLDASPGSGERNAVAPQSASSCVLLLDYLQLRLKSESFDVERTAWSVIGAAAYSDATLRYDDRQPLKAAKYLLGLASEVDLFADTGMSFVELRRKESKSASATLTNNKRLRQRAAAWAASFGGSEHAYNTVSLSTGHGEKNLNAVALELWNAIKAIATDDIMLHGLAVTHAMTHEARSTVLDPSGPSESDTGQPGAHEPQREQVKEFANEPELVSTRVAEATSPNETVGITSDGSPWLVAIRRLSRLHQKPLLVRARREAKDWSIVATFGMFIVIGFAILIQWGKLTFYDRSTDIDPLGQLAAGEAWTPGLGPSMEIRGSSNASNLQLNPHSEVWFFGTVATGRFLNVDAEFDDYQGTPSLAPGVHRITVPVRLVVGDDPRTTGAITTGASIRLGLLPSSKPLDNIAVFVRLSADGIAPIWDGESFLLACDCTIAIDPESIELYSDAIPTGDELGESALTSSALIGYEEPNGVLRSGLLDRVRIVANLVVTERQWED